MPNQDIRPTPSYVVGAYAASPAHSEWRPELEREFFEALEALPQLGALELPWLGRLHPHDDEWLHSHFPPRWSAVMTDIGHVMSRVSGASVGLASPSAGGRAAALADAELLRTDIRRFNDNAGRQVVFAVELHSVPRQTCDPFALAESLAEICAWDWDGAQIVIEHCDAFIQGQTPEKGFLTLYEEIRAIALSGSPAGISLNWGRSAIELRDAERVVEHVRTAAASSLLAGLIFSGAADRPGRSGGAWVDAHHSFAPTDQHPFGDPASLLTEARVAAALDAAAASPNDVWLGAKVGWAHPGGAAVERARMIEDALAALDRQKPVDQVHAPPLRRGIGIAPQ